MWFRIFVLNATVNNISVILRRSVLFVEEAGVPRENHQPVASLTNCIEYTSALAGFELTTLVVIGTDYTGSHKSNYHKIMTTMAPSLLYGFLYLLVY